MATSLSRSLVAVRIDMPDESDELNDYWAARPRFHRVLSRTTLTINLYRVWRQTVGIICEAA